MLERGIRFRIPVSGLIPFETDLSP
jgi:hypothetical protein